MNIWIKITIVVATGLAMLVLLVTCAPLKMINALTPENQSRVSTDLVYGDGPRHKLDIYSPTKLKNTAPVVIFFYGGSWNSGSRTDYAFVGRELAARGIVTVIADYRLYPEVRYPAFLEDSAQAVAWTFREVSRYGGDPKRLFVMGHSAGAYNAAMLALDKRWLAKQGMTPSILQGWIGLAGPYDFIPIENPDVKPVFFFPDTPSDSQPLAHVSSIAPPSLLIAAGNDTIVNPVRNTGGLARALRAQGIAVTEHYFDYVSHASLIATLSSSLHFLSPAIDEIVQFVFARPDRQDAPQKTERMNAKPVAALANKFTAPPLSPR